MNTSMRLGLFVATGVYWPDTNGGPPPEDDWIILLQIAVFTLAVSMVVGAVWTKAAGVW